MGNSYPHLTQQILVLFSYVSFIFYTERSKSPVKSQIPCNVSSEESEVSAENIDLPHIELKKLYQDHAVKKKKEFSTDVGM